MITERSFQDKSNQNFQVIFKERKKFLDSMCIKYKDKKHLNTKVPVKAYSSKTISDSVTEHYYANDGRLNQKVLPRSHLLDHKRKIMYCWNFKVAASFWMWIFTKIHTGKEPPVGKPTWPIQYKMSPKSLSSFHQAVSSYQNILLVRHPMVRLVSAYRDRVEGLKFPFRFFEKVASALHLTRVDTKLNYSLKRGIKGKVVSFNYTKPIAVPTWPEFVRYILSTERSRDVSI